MKIIQNNSWLVPLAVTLIFTGCAVGPKFKSPDVATPEAYIYDSLRGSDNTLVNIDWWDNFGDTTLTMYIQEALDSNRNLLVAMSRIEQSRLQFRLTKANMGPSIGLGIDARVSSDSKNIIQNYSIEPKIAWELDLFGKFRRASESAKANFLATEQNYRSVMLSLVSEVATTYFNLLQYNMLLRISQETYELRNSSQNIIDSMLYYGMSSAVNLEQARSLTATAAAAIPKYQRAVVQTEMALCALIGHNPHSIEVDGMKLLSLDMIPKEVPSGLPTSLLNRRPDIRQAYYEAASTSANIGVAVANRYPSITLTGSGGILATSIEGLFKANPFGWFASISILQPIFSFGKNKRAVEIAKEINKQAILNYEQSVIEALGEVDSALNGVITYRLQSGKYRELLHSTQLTRKLTQELYRNGANTYLDVLDAERDLFSTQIVFAEILSSQLAEYVSLYKALGGGWNP